MSKKCGDCGSKEESYEYCPVCDVNVCDGCHDSHSCVEDLIEEYSETLDALSPGDGDYDHSIECDDPQCRGCEDSDYEEDEDRE